MKNIIDTNPIINACIFQSYKIKMISYFQDSDSLMILTIYNEIKDKLLKLHTCLCGFERFSAIKGDKKFLLLFFKDIKEVSEQVYHHIKNSKDKNIVPLIKKLQRTVGILSAYLKDLPLYPGSDLIKVSIINKQKKILQSKLPKIKDNDLKHLYLMDNYTQDFASEINFYTEDKKDYLNNKEKIENVLKDIKILNFKNY